MAGIFGTATNPNPRFRDSSIGDCKYSRAEYLLYVGVAGFSRTVWDSRVIGQTNSDLPSRQSSKRHQLYERQEGRSSPVLKYMYSFGACMLAIYSMAFPLRCGYVCVAQV